MVEGEPGEAQYGFGPICIPTTGPPRKFTRTVGSLWGTVAAES